MFVLICYFFVLISSYATACDRCVHQSKAAYFTSDLPLSSGACGYGSLAPTFNGGFLAAGVSSWYKKGAGCGACFQIRCKNSTLCSKSGTEVIMTDLNTNSNVDFVLSGIAFKAMAKPGKDKDVLKLGITEIEYKRIPCDYKGRNLTIRVEDFSRNPSYLAIKVLYQGGQTEIAGIEIAPIDGIGAPNWIDLRPKYGAVWDTSGREVPNGPLQFKFIVTLGYDGAYIWAQTVLPADWKPTVTYNTQVQITAIAQEGCSSCDHTEWK